MRKRIRVPTGETTPPQPEDWLVLDKVAEVEISSENSDSPIDLALLPGSGQGWRATQSGAQTIRLIFDEPQKLSKIRLVFIENQHSRTQEFVLAWSSDGNRFKEIVRQQYNFNPPSTEVEEYQVALEDVKMLDLKITPDINGGSTTASLSELRLG